MPNQKTRQRERNEDREASGMEEGYLNDSRGKQNSRIAADGVGAREEYNGHGHANTITNDPRSRHNRSDGASQLKKNAGIGEWNHAVSETVRSLEAAHQSINLLQDKLSSHMGDIRDIEETRNRLNQMEELCSEKNEEIERQDNTITTLTNKSHNTRQELEHQRKMIEREKNEIEQEKSKQEKRVNTAMAEEKIKLQNEFDKLMSNQLKTHDRRRKDLEDEFAKQRSEINKKLAIMDAEMKRLLIIVEGQKTTIEAQKKELEKTTEQCDLLERAKDSFKREKQDRERELETIRNEFALNHISKDDLYVFDPITADSADHFINNTSKQRFAAIQRHIEEISLKFFVDVDGKDLDKVHEELSTADPCFTSVPIDDSDDSRDLCVAHAQRIVSSAICEYIWKPLHSEFTLLHPELNGLLRNMLDELEKSSGGRSVFVWKALTMQALQSLSVQLPASRNSEVQNPPAPSVSGRAQSVVSNVLSKLSPLVSSSHSYELQKDLHKLASEAIKIWNDAQTGNLKIAVFQSLDHARTKEWWHWDPESPKDNLDIMSESHNRILCLFPHVVAWEIVDVVEHTSGPPGSWPVDLKQAPCAKETCIHPGRGLPEWSPLVVRGQKMQEEKIDFISKALETAKKELHSTRRVSGHSRRGSIGSSISVAT
ncbi:MAG: hypothetical protein M1829_002566 [Trizodia sp. TS-e1964]|nr:MAG: hypothetical protein M1829_002566 [Trizodia sp. TS-e1964]